MNKKKLLSLGGALLLGTYFLFAQKQPVGDEFLDAADWQNG